MAILVLISSLVVQLAAAYSSLRLIKVTGKKRAWLCITFAFVLMAARRATTLYRAALDLQEVDIYAESIAIAISLLLMMGLLLIGPIIHEISRADEVAALNLELRAAQSTLEEQVHARTAKLESVNQQLQKSIHDRERMAEKSRIQQEQLAHHSRLVTMGELLAGIAHELNQPLSAVSNHAAACQLQLNHGGRSELLASGLQEISAAAIRAGTIIKTLRGFASKSAQTRTSIDLSRVVEKSIKLLDADIRSHSVHVDMNLDSELAPVNANEIQMQQVIINLVKNAVDALREQSGDRRVRVTTSMADGFARVSVVDNGPGIDVEAENPNALLDAFHTTKSDGMGIGLAVCRSIVEEHRGRIWYKDNPNQQGAAFYFSIPPLKAECL